MTFPIGRQINMSANQIKYHKEDIRTFLRTNFSMNMRRMSIINPCHRKKGSFKKNLVFEVKAPIVEKDNVTGSFRREEKRYKTHLNTVHINGKRTRNLFTLFSNM